MRAPLMWLGARARYVLSIGVIAALFLPSLSAWLRPALPYLVSLVLIMAMVRIDLLVLVKAAIRPRRLVLLVFISLLLMPVTALIYVGISNLFDIPEPWRDSLIYLAAAPPIASSAGLCFLLGFNAALALEVAVFVTLMMPFLGVATVNWLIGDAPDISALAMSMRLGWIILIAVIVSQVARRIFGAARILRNGQILDGLGALVMLTFVVPLFDGIGPLIMDDPTRALIVLGLAFMVNLGGNILVLLTVRRFRPLYDAGAMGVLNGNRAVAIYLAVIPATPVFALFVALYQIPMYFTPLLARLIPRARHD